MTKDRRSAPVVVTDGQPGLPYSKGLTASPLMATGLSPYRSYQVAERVEERLLERAKPEVTSEALRALTVRVLEEVAGDRYAKNFVRWQEVAALEVPHRDPDRRGDGRREVDHRHPARRAAGHRPGRRHRRDPRGHALDVQLRG